MVKQFNNYPRIQNLLHSVSLLPPELQHKIREFLPTYWKEMLIRAQGLVEGRGAEAVQQMLDVFRGINLDTTGADDEDDLVLEDNSGYE